MIESQTISLKQKPRLESQNGGSWLLKNYLLKIFVQGRLTSFREYNYNYWLCVYSYDVHANDKFQYKNKHFYDFISNFIKVIGN